ncbi:ABC transporter ATP-binding protein [Paracidovorax konjaci]|uniref:Carbohydrate ABC transporter ATP-binding protein, CUT1 family n=1 Tax=Paracidovorax konjaci TaxID=32040 RepID=A0A1I1VEE6_9BURK|nr:ABC transporter ATP-binding protein [Paracidovorax konjaci]SFD78830.1 carbohydrate ABC transporter ATP-binding protein, CUT1 family [Paracidovorax konjaci]
MQLDLERIGKKVGAQTWLHGMDMALQPGAVTVLLGATQAGKTSLMRIMAGLDAPTEGRVRVDGVDVTGMPVRERNVAMVYQQFINYPSMTVADNIASPLRLRGEKNVQERVRALAERLHIDMFLARHPAELSGGQQQRVALARALAKGAPLMLLDEPLVNLDYKLREELRDELTQLFAAGDSTVVYATTEPGEALLLGGYTAVLHEGELLQYGPTAEVFHTPSSLRVARAFSDPPMNLLPAEAVEQGVRVASREVLALPQPLPAGAAGGLTVGVRASALRLAARPGDVAVPGTVELAEIAGSDTFVHAETPWGGMVAQFTGVHDFALGAAITLHLQPGDVYVFGADGALLRAPARRGGR